MPRAVRTLTKSQIGPISDGTLYGECQSERRKHLHDRQDTTTARRSDRRIEHDADGQYLASTDQQSVVTNYNPATQAGLIWSSARWRPATCFLRQHPLRRAASHRHHRCKCSLPGRSDPPFPSILQIYLLTSTAAADRRSAQALTIGAGDRSERSQRRRLRQQARST